MSFLHDLKIAVRSLARVRALWITVALTLALGIGANAAIFSVVRAVLLRPLANRDEDRLLYIRQSAPGIGQANATFSVPEIADIGSGLKIDQGTGHVFRDRLHDCGAGHAARDSGGRGGWALLRGDGIEAGAGAVAGAGRRWSECGGRGGADVSLLEDVAAFRSQRIGKDGASGELQRRAFRDGGGGSGTVGAVPGGDGDYCQRGDQPASSFGHHGDGTRASHDGGVCAAGSGRDGGECDARSCTRYTAACWRRIPEVYKPEDHFQIGVTRMHDQINARANTILWMLFAASGLLFVIASSNVANLVLARTVRREPELAVRSALGASTAVLAPFAAGGEPGAVRQRGDGGRAARRFRWWRCWAGTRRASRCAPTT